jgi:hypothetical protein
MALQLAVLLLMNPSSNPQYADTSVNTLKTITFVVGGAIFFAVSIVVACKARHYQLSNQPMPNVKGGFMTFLDGYSIASVFFLVSVGWFVAARKSWRRQPTQEHANDQSQPSS